jgi:DegV family protein with EDD domain
MKIKLIADSSCDLPVEFIKENNITLVPLTMTIGGVNYLDDSKLNLEEYLRVMKASKDYPKTACPTPNQFLEAYGKDYDAVFVVTLTSKLSGTYNSAMVAKQMFEETNKKTLVHIFDSKSATAAEGLIMYKLVELVKQGLAPKAIIEQVEKFIDQTTTLFLLESIDNLVKNGRIKPILAKVIGAFSIKPILGTDGQGEIKLIHRVIGYERAFHKLVEAIGEKTKDFKDKVLVIAHANNLDRAKKFYDEVVKRYDFKKVIIAKMNGLSSTYADVNGIVIAF